LKNFFLFGVHVLVLVLGLAMHPVVEINPDWTLP